jgi:hypothetical protein
MTIETAHKGSIGTKIVITCLTDEAIADGISLASATVKKLYARAPSGIAKEWAATVSGTNALSYTTIAGDLDESGTWAIQAYIASPLWTGRGDTVAIRVLDDYK